MNAVKVRPRRPIARLALPLVLLVAATGLAACSGDDGPRLTIYSGRTRNLVGPLLEEFSESTGIGIDVRYGDSAELALLIEEEGDNSPADVFISQSPGAVGFLAEAERLAPLPDGTADAVDEQFRGERWVGLSGRVRVLVHNTDEVDAADLPDSVRDLTGSEYRGRVAVAPSNGSFQDFITAMRLIDGPVATGDFLEGLADNDPEIYANNTAIVQAVGRGEVEMGLVNHYYALRFLSEDPDLPVANHFFEGGDIGSLLIATAASIIDTADQPDLAAQFIEFLLSEDAQTFFANETFEYPLAAGVEPAADVPSLDSLDLPEVDLERLGGDLRATVAMIEERGFAE